ncbi:gamma-aminobutyric acid type B receptor subunit 2-like [Ptychodera flava]|uniref:gamma-aminobutyric acid type B receptor subunit 2-like n=1 Tax=Ptychodera flava TaxID=63121 RepID=UPI00396A2F9B
MFAKTWRVHQIFIATKRKNLKVMITDADLFGLIGILLAVDVCFLALWEVFDPLVDVSFVTLRDNIVIDHEDVVLIYSRHVCENKYSTAFSLSLYSYKGLFLLCGVYLAWSTRKVSIPALNDSSFIGLSVYNVLVVSVIALTVNTFVNNVTIRYSLVSTVLLVATTNTLCLVFVPKIISKCSKKSNDSAVGTRFHCTSSMSLEKVEDKMALRSELAKKLTQLSDLQEMYRLLGSQDNNAANRGAAEPCACGCWIDVRDKKDKCPARNISEDTAGNMSLNDQEQIQATSI